MTYLILFYLKAQFLESPLQKSYTLVRYGILVRYGDQLSLKLRLHYVQR